MIQTVQSPSLLRPNHAPDPVALAFGRLSGKRYYGAYTWLRRDYPQQVELALRAHREADAWARREAWAAGIVAELHHVPDRVLDDDLLLEHLAADQNDDHWRVAFVNYRTTETRRHWCRALSRFHSLNLAVMRELKRDEF